MNTIRKTGATLLEITMVIGIIAVIAISAIMFYQTASTGAKINESINNITTLTSVTRNTFLQQGNYDGLTNAVITRAGTFPENLRVAGDNAAIKHSWNSAGGVTIAEEAQANGDDTYFTITYAGIPNKACVDVVSKLYRQYETPDPEDGVYVNGAQITGVADATVQCDDANDDNTLLFVTR